MSFTLSYLQAIWERRRLAIIFGVVYVVMSVFAMAHFLNSSYLGERYFKTNFDGMYNGTIHQPFVYRQFIPTLSRWVTLVTPDSVQYAVNDMVHDIKTAPALHDFRGVFPWIERTFPHADKHYPRVVAALLIYLCLWGYIWATYRLARQQFPDDPAIGYFAPIFGILLISSFSWPFQYVYDIPVLFLSTLCYFLIAAKRWLPYLAVFALACWNKETAIFIFFFTAIWQFGRMRWQSYINLMIAQYVVYALIRIGLVYLYQDNTGEYLKTHLFRVWPGDLFSTSQYERIFNFAVIFFLLTYQWAHKPAYLKYGLWLLPPMYLAYLIYGMPNEYRVFFDVMPLPLLLGVHTLIAGTGLSQAALFHAKAIHNDKVKS